MFNQNTQLGFGVTLMLPTDPTLPDEVHDFFRDEQLCGTDLIFTKFKCKTFIAFATQKPSTFDK